MRRVGFVDDFSWLPESHAVHEHARKRPRFDDAPTALSEQDIVLAAYDFVAKAAARTTYNPKEALALIGEAEGTRGGASCERRYKVAAKARRGEFEAEADWKHWRKAHRRSVQAAITQELYESLIYDRDDDEEDVAA